jgi:hypothetical protein
MHASLPKQIAYNQRILKAGQEIDGSIAMWQISCQI